MEILGVGPMELVFILILALILLGPQDMVKAGRTIGGAMRRIVKSEAWAGFQVVSHNLRQLPTRLMREAGLEEEMENVKKDQSELRQRVDSIQRMKSDSRPGANEIDDHSIGGAMPGMAAWLGKPTPAEAADPGLPSEGLLAWVTPAEAPHEDSPKKPARSDPNEHRLAGEPQDEDRFAHP